MSSSPQALQCYRTFLGDGYSSSTLDLTVSHKRRRVSSAGEFVSYASETPMKRMKKAVSFNDNENKQITIAVSSDEKKNAWYDLNEYREFHEDARATALSVKLGISQLIEPDDFCVRGLEVSICPNASMLRRVKRKLLVSSVLHTQRSHQQTFGAVNHDEIRDVCAVFSTDAHVDAVKRGLEDFVDAHDP